MTKFLRHLLFKHHLEEKWARLYRIAYSWCHDPQLSKDLVQDTVMKALKNTHQLKDAKALDNWLFSILVNCWRDFCRQKKDTVEISEIILSHNESPEEQNCRTATINRVREAVSGLSREHREIITLIDLEEMSYKDVAEVLGIPLGTVMSRLCRARRQLKDTLKDMDVNPPSVRIRRIK